jgi:hypothetical protein
MGIVLPYEAGFCTAASSRREESASIAGYFAPKYNFRGSQPGNNHARPRCQSVSVEQTARANSRPGQEVGSFSNGPGKRSGSLRTSIACSGDSCRSTAQAGRCPYAG